MTFKICKHLVFHETNVDGEFAELNISNTETDVFSDFGADTDGTKGGKDNVQLLYIYSNTWSLYLIVPYLKFKGLMSCLLPSNMGSVSFIPSTALRIIFKFSLHV